METLSNITSIIVGASGAIGRAVLQERLQDCAPEHILALSRGPSAGLPEGVTHRSIDLMDESTIAAAFKGLKRGQLTFVFVATGVLHTKTAGPEKATRLLSPDFMAETYAVNTIGPALIAKAALPLLAKDQPAYFGALSARVGSISDNRLGGWHSYRASKAALNMILKTVAIEGARTHPKLVIAGLHPGTVDSPLSEPFQGNVPDGKLFTPAYSASQLYKTLIALTPSDSGQCFAYDGVEIPT